LPLLNGVTASPQTAQTKPVFSSLRPTPNSLVSRWLETEGAGFRLFSRYRFQARFARGLFTACAITSGSCFTGFPDPDHDDVLVATVGQHCHPPPVGVHRSSL